MNETLLGKEIIMIIEIFGENWWKQIPGREYYRVFGFSNSTLINVTRFFNCKFVINIR